MHFSTNYLISIKEIMEVIMVKVKLSDLLGKHKMNQKTLSNLTKIRPATISKMYYGETKRVTLEQINNICSALDCEISELFEYIPDKEENK